MILTKMQQLVIANEIVKSSSCEAWGYLYDVVVSYLQSLPEEKLVVPLEHYVRRTIRFERPRFYQNEKAFWAQPKKEKP
jgi:hypothetical protein